MKLYIYDEETKAVIAVLERDNQKALEREAIQDYGAGSDGIAATYTPAFGTVDGLLPMARRFHGRLVTREDILAAGAREADPARYSDDPDAGFVFPDGSTGGFGLYQNGALIQEDGRDLFAAQ